MKMSPKFVIRLGIWCALMLYLLFDLILFDGPLKKQAVRISGSPTEDLANDLERGIVARVFTKPILLSQVDYGVDDYLWRSSRPRDDVGEKERVSLRKHILRELCDHALLREKVALNNAEFPVSDAEITAAMRRFSSRFATPKELVKATQNFGFEGEKELRFRIAARLQQNKYLDYHIARGIAVSDAEAEAWYKDNASALTTPQLRRVRHIFLAKLEHSEQDARNILDKLLQELISETTSFASLSSTYNEDLRCKDDQGDLGWMSQLRIPDDFADSVFKLKLNQPSIIETKLGWHLIEITGIQPAQLASFESLKQEIIIALETTRRKEAVTEYRKNLHRQHPNKVVIHTSMLSQDWTN
jgi:parvulin-like peptidyl-prolyl isomerase